MCIECVLKFNQTLPVLVIFFLVMKCSRCKADMNLRTKKDNQGFFISCMGYPQCKNAIWLPSMVDKVRVTDEACDIVCIKNK